VVIVQWYPLAVALCFVTMLCWGSWANTQKLASREWSFQLFYWDYALGVFLLAIAMALTLGSAGSLGRPFAKDLAQANGSAVTSAFVGGAVFNLGNILLVAAIDIAGMAVAFPVGVGLALVLGVIMTYVQSPIGNPGLLFLGVAAVTAAIILDAVAYRMLPSAGQRTTPKGILLSVASGLLLGVFYPFVARSMSIEFTRLEPGKLGPYSAVVMASLGILLSTFLWNGIVMMKPFVGERVPFGDYFTKGSLRLHAIGILGGLIWSLGFSLSIVACGAAGYAISYGLGQGATMVAAAWGVFIWKEFAQAPPKARRLLGLMFAFYIVGLGLIISSRLVA
jgi:glucose uptake protein